ncbi:MAG: hypothetical protein HOG76_09590 [Candidatus Marinimicrobia bacterium]|jgi:hypothetical protein|nr:hypothetical protein [Candidatus Neomarinimicrobiota bacterium]MBT3629808.1 hypothetical protein [Candidatus Neomarinimicrobiota bacterium]MBT5315041.1 hypothetical protein [Candidatus Neomarinimicrobiota bacterium]MBT6003074.1 hypothetical protein [Candidatus Neomarinimicrobiota bacterium]MBT7200677.1 hypothetical protein [Candidatus Neomarinimicrobiota bacterium]
MSKKLNLFAVLVLALMVMFTVSCEGPAGEDGLAGTAGADGTDGTDGADGADANEFCIDCHSTEVMGAIWDDYETSAHGLGSAVARGASDECALCHSSEGFIAFAANPGPANSDVANATGVPYPTRVSCETCHGDHGSLEGDLTAPIRTTAAVTNRVDGSELDLGGSSNLCISCHQARKYGSYYADVDTLSDGSQIHADSVYVSSSHAGPHYSNNANMLLGLGGYGTSSTGTHASAGCTSCHMSGEAGHTFAPDAASCTESCHSSGTPDFMITNFDTRYDAIQAALIAEGALAMNSYGSVGPVKGMFHKDVFEALWNERALYYDHSHGVHNPGYANTLLTIAEARLGL